MNSVFIERAIEAIESGEVRRVDGTLFIKEKEYQYKAYSISGVRPLIRIDIQKKEGERWTDK